MYKRILVPLDGSELAEQVLPYVRSLARGLEAKIALLRVMDPLPAGLTDPAHGLTRDRVIASMRSHAQDYVDKVATSLKKDPRLAISSAVTEGDPGERIVSEADRDPDTLIAMTTHGRSGLVRWLLGSVADKVLHAAKRPLLLVRSRDPKQFTPEAHVGSIIVPLDGSPTAEQALPHVGSLAKALGLKVVLLRAVPPLEEYYRFVGPEYIPPPDLPKEVEAEANEYLGRLKERLHKDRFPTVEVRLLQGNAAASIVDVAEQTSDSLIVMTTHGRSGVGRWILGSVANRVVRYAASPVLMIRAQ